MIRVLIADDSASVRACLAHILEGAGMAVVGQAKDGEEAVRLASLLRPSVVTMDIDMPRLDGFQATRRIMEIAPAPIVIVSAQYDKTQMRKTFAAIEAGALAIMEKPGGIGPGRCVADADELVRTITLMSRVHLGPRPQPPIPGRHRHPDPDRPGTVRLAAIGSSTGGPQSLKAILSRLAPDLGVPLLAVQHMTPGFLPGMIDWLEADCPLPIAAASQGQPALPGHVYFAPDGLHLEVDPSLRLHLVPGPHEHGATPSVSHLLRSLARAVGRDCLAVLLSGMGEDGAAELKILSDLGARTVVQSEETCAVFGMPGQAQRLGARALALAPNEIADLLNALPRRNGDVAP